MASVINISSLTLNPLEESEVSKFVLQKIINDPELVAIHGRINNGVTMQEQIVLASQLSKTGIKDNSCTRPNSVATFTATQKYWLPKAVGDTLIHCQKDVDALFKAYYTKIKKYEDLFDIEGSNLNKLMMTLLSDSQLKAISRLAWFGETAVAQSGAGAAGLKLAADIKFYDIFNGLWNQIFTAVGAGTIAHTTTKLAALNALTSTAAQTNLATGDAEAVFEDMWNDKASLRLRQEPGAQFLVTKEIFENYKKTLKTAGEAFTIEYTMEGLPSLKWDGKKVINMESLWDLRNRADFEQDSTNNAYYLPNRVVLTIPDNIPLATLDENDLSTLENWYNRDDRVMKTSYGYTLDAKVIDEDLIVVAY